MEEIYMQYESHIATLFGWPLWITRTIITLCTAISIVGVFQLDQLRQLNNLMATSADSKENTWKFRQFQMAYLVVYLTIMLADWLQGTNMYTLYSVRSSYFYYICMIFCVTFSCVSCSPMG